MLTFNLKTTFFTVKTSNEVYCCRIYFVNYIQNVHIINRTLHGSLEDMDFMHVLVAHSNIKSISSRNRVISYIYTQFYIIVWVYNRGDFGPRCAKIVRARRLFPANFAFRCFANNNFKDVKFSAL